MNSNPSINRRNFLAGVGAFLFVSVVPVGACAVPQFTLAHVDTPQRCYVVGHVSFECDLDAIPLEFRGELVDYGNGDRRIYIGDTTIHVRPSQQG